MRGKFVFIPFFFLGMIALAGFVVMELWNWLMPAIFDLTIISYWQALGLLVLGKLIFGGFGWRCGGCCGGGYHHYWKHKFKKKWHHMSDDDKAKWEQRFGSCGYGPKHQESEESKENQ